jgi:AhpD family alkylhydroperoxidase
MLERLDYTKLSPELNKAYYAFSTAVKASGVGQSLIDLINLRVSQINGCAFCVDMHSKEAKIHGERELRLYHLPIWRESSLFDARERAALEWAEVLTHLPPHGVPDAIYDSVRAVFSEKEMAELSFAVMAINGWNRLSIGFRSQPGSRDALYGLTKAGLS